MTAQDKNTDNIAKTINYDIAENHGHVPVMRERMAQLLAPAIEASLLLVTPFFLNWSHRAKKCV